MSAAAEEYKRIAIDNLKEEAAVEDWALDSDAYKTRFRAIVARANEMVAGAAAPVEAPAFKEPKRVDPPWENKWKDYMCKDFKAMFGQLQELQKGTWTKDKMHDSFRMDGSKTRRWVSPDGETLVRVTQRKAPPDEDSMGMYELCTCPSNYRDVILANKEAKEQAKAEKKAQAKANKEAKEARKAAREAKKAAKDEAPAEEDPSQKEPPQEADAEKGRAGRTRTRGGEARAAGPTLTGTLLRAKNEAAAKALIKGKGKDIKTKGQLAAEKAAALAAAAAAAQAPAAATPTATPAAAGEGAHEPEITLTQEGKEQLAKLPKPSKKGGGAKKGADPKEDKNKKGAAGSKPAGGGKRRRVDEAEQSIAKTRPRRQ